MKTTKHRSLQCVLLTLLIFDISASGQGAGHAGRKAPRSREDYELRALKEVAALKPNANDLRDKQGRLVVTADILPSILVEDFREADTTRPAARITFRDMRFGRPPLAYLSFDVLIRNDRKSPRWFLLPSNLGPGHASIGEKGGVDTLEVFAPRGKGRVIVGRFLGTGGFHAMLLPPGAEVRLRRFPISYWGEPPANLQIEVVIARQLTIGGQSAEGWFGENSMSSVTADITEEAESPTTMVRSRRTHDNKEVAPVITVDRKLQLEVPLEMKKRPAQ